MLRALVLVAIAALLASVQCDGRCAAAACELAQTPSDCCPHPQDSHDKQAACPHQHSEFAAPQAGVVKYGAAQAETVLLALTPGWAVISLAPPVQLLFDSGSPPLTSILRI